MSVGLYDQHARIVLLRGERPALASIHSQVVQNVAVRLDLAMKAFFRRVKAGETPGFPRFRGAGRYDSFCYPQSGFSLQGERVRLSKIGDVPLVLHRPLEGEVKTCCVRRTATGKWFVTFSCEVESTPLPVAVPQVGIDVGLSSFATLSTGEQIATPRFFRKDEKALAQVNRRLSRQEKWSPAWKKRKKAVAHVHERISLRRTDFAHQHSRRIVDGNQVIAVLRPVYQRDGAYPLSRQKHK